MGTDYNQNEIDKYIQEEMDAGEREAFLKKIESDDQLAEEVHFQEELAKTIILKNLMGDAIHQFEAKGLHQELPEEKQPARIRNLRRVLTIAASITILAIMLGGGFIWANINYSNGALAALDYETLQSDAGARSNDEVLQDAFNSGIAAIEQQDFDNAQRILRTIPEEDSNYYLSRLYLSFIQYTTGDYQTAISNADILLKNQALPPRYRDRAEWLKVKSLLANNQVTEAQELVEKIIKESTHVFNEDARQLANSLNSFWRKLTF